MKAVVHWVRGCQGARGVEVVSEEEERFAFAGTVDVPCSLEGVASHKVLKSLRVGVP
jgi:hypothetical protein